MNNSVLSCQNITKTFGKGELATHVLKGVSFDIKKGESVAIVGMSGSGKSTLLHILGGLDEPSTGMAALNMINWRAMKERQRDQWRNLHLGMVYQQHHLLKEFTALENVAMPLLIRGLKKEEAEHEAAQTLMQVGLGHRLQHTPSALSGGERQRVSIARAVVTKPQCILADEPTGNLDRQTAHQVFDVFKKMSEQTGTAIVLVTHDTQLAQQMDRRLHLIDGKIIS